MYKTHTCYFFKQWNMGFVENLHTEPTIREWNSSLAEVLQTQIDSQVYA